MLDSFSTWFGGLTVPLKLSFIVLCVALVMGALMRRSSTGKRYFQEGRVTGIVGRKGHGKTVFLVHELRRHVGTKVRCNQCTRKHGKPVWHYGKIASNGILSLPPDLAEHYIHVTGWADLVDLPHCTLIGIDEMHLWAPATAGLQLPEYVRWLLSQCRKLGLEIVWVSQHEDRVSLGVRRQTDEVGVCKRGMFRAMKVEFYEPEDLRKKGVKPAWRFRYKVTKKVASAYNTYELLQPDQTANATVEGFTDGRPTVRNERGRLSAIPAEPSEAEQATA
jgi:hypothetical protein